MKKLALAALLVAAAVGAVGLYMLGSRGKVIDAAFVESTVRKGMNLEEAASALELDPHKLRRGLFSLADGEKAVKIVDRGTFFSHELIYLYFNKEGKVRGGFVEISGLVVEDGRQLQLRWFSPPKSQLP